MPIANADNAVSAAPAFHFGGGTFSARRAFAWSGGPPSPAVPGAGDAIDGVALPDGKSGYLASIGLPVEVEAGAAFAVDDALEVDALGRFVPLAGGKQAARALEAAGSAGAVAWVVLQRAEGAGGGGGGGAPVGATYVTFTADGTLTAEKVLGSAVIMSGTLGARSAAATAGRLYYVTDSGDERLTRDTGAGWTDLVTDWDYVTGKPGTFTPAAHVHAMADITSGNLAASRLSSGTFASGGSYRLAWDETSYGIRIKRAQNALSPGHNPLSYLNSTEAAALFYVGWDGGIFSAGTVTATAFDGAHIGDGSGLTNLDAGDISAGTLPTIRGGTGNNWNAAVANTIPYFSGVGVMGLLAAPGTDGYVLQRIAGALAWGSAPAPTNVVVVDPIAAQYISAATAAAADLVLENTQTLGGTGGTYSPRLAFRNDHFTSGLSAGGMEMWIQSLATSPTAAQLEFGLGSVAARIKSNGQIQSTATSGTPPFIVASGDLVANLNADAVDGNHASAFAAAAHTHGAGDTVSGIFAAARLGAGTPSADTFLVGDGNWDFYARRITTADQAIGTAATNVTGLTVPLAASSKYRFRAILAYMNGAATNVHACRAIYSGTLGTAANGESWFTALGMNGAPGAFAASMLLKRITLAVNAAMPATTNGFGNTGSTTAIAQIEVEGLICTNTAGDLNIAGISNAAGGFNVQAGSYIEVWQAT